MADVGLNIDSEHIAAQDVGAGNLAGIIESEKRQLPIQEANGAVGDFCFDVNFPYAFAVLAPPPPAKLSTMISSGARPTRVLEVNGCAVAASI
jgi:hypothetical protein